MNEVSSFILEQHRAGLRNPHKPRRGKRSRFPRLRPRFNYRRRKL